ncbi:podocan-like [Diadema antillarum]|uniref:podocan-like n=1 Tax=Diadema antillarum TaxID=105358 RepID=UPI003A889A8B
MDLTSVPRDLPIDTEILDLSMNKITALYKTSFSPYKQLEVLIIRSNDISFIDSGTFLKMSFLRSLDLSNNGRLPVLRGDMFAKGALANIQLNRTNLAHVSDDIFKAMIVPATLGLRDNALRNISWTDCHNVAFHIVSLPGNNFTELSEQSFVMDCRVDLLDLSYNPIRFVSPATISSLRVEGLDMSGILLPEKELQHLFEGVRSSSSITYLYLREMGLTSLRPGLFDALQGKYLRQLDLGINELRQLIPRGFENLTDVYNLALNANWLEAIELSHFSASATFVTLGLIVIYYNRWKIRYGLFLCKIHFIGYREIIPREQREDFKYDMYIVTHDDDEEWTDRIFIRGMEENLPDYGRLAIGDEALRLGMYYLDSVNLLVENSFKVIFLISAKALRDHMFLLKFRLALDHVNEVQTEKIVLVFREEIPDADLPFLIRLFLSDNRAYLMWPRDFEGQPYFWEQLAKYMIFNRYCNPLVPP